MVGEVTPQVGWYATACCEIDLHRINTEAELTEHLAEEPWDDGTPFYRFWPSMEAAMADLQ